MEFYGNSSDPLAKTLADLQKSSVDSELGNNGDFFKSVHDRDTHVKPTNHKDEPVEFNAVILKLDDSASMLKYILLKNKIVDADCFGIEETTHVEKESGDTTVFLKWLQPRGLYELGTATLTINPTSVTPIPGKPSPIQDHEGDTGTDVTDDTSKKKYKGKGSRKKNTKVRL